MVKFEKEKATPKSWVSPLCIDSLRTHDSSLMLEIMLDLNQ
jgi:hypothetical protein